MSWACMVVRVVDSLAQEEKGKLLQRAHKEREKREVRH